MSGAIRMVGGLTVVLFVAVGAGLAAITPSHWTYWPWLMAAGIVLVLIPAIYLFVSIRVE